MSAFSFNLPDADGVGGDTNKHRPVKRMMLAESVASRYQSPIDISIKYHDDAVRAGQSVGVLLPDAINFDGVMTYADNAETGESDQRQGYIAEIRKRDDGLIRPVITFNSFRDGGKTVQWRPDDLLWKEHNSESQPRIIYDTQPYNDKAEALAKDHSEKRARRDNNDLVGRAVVAMTAAKLINGAQTCTAHDYLTTKGICSHGAFIATSSITGALYDQAKGEIVTGQVCETGELIIPLYRDGQIVTLQRIKADGTKLFLKGGSTSGCYYKLEGTEDGPAFIAEGFATAATICEATGRNVYFALNAYNLKAVADSNFDIGAVAADGGEAGIRGAVQTGLPYYTPPEECGGDDWNDYAAKHGATAVKTALDDVEMKTRKSSSSINNGWDLAANAKPPRFLVDGFLEEDAHGILGGASMTYKSFFVLRLAHSINSGEPFMGRQVYKKGSVVYVCGEGQGAMTRRLRALQILLEARPEFPIELVVTGVSLICQESMAELRRKLIDLKPVLVIFDTFGSLSGGIEENSNSEVGQALNLVRDTCRAAGASSMIVHHFGKDADKGFRGASAFVNNVDYAFVAQKRGAEKYAASLSCFKMKDGEHFEDILFRTEVVSLGIYDQNEKESTSMVATHDADGVCVVRRTAKDITREVLCELLEKEKQRMAEAGQDGVAVIKWAAWEKAAKLEGVSNVRRSRDALRDDGVAVEVRRGLYRM